jgi:hypothetical protein
MDWLWATDQSLIAATGSVRSTAGFEQDRADLDASNHAQHAVGVGAHLTPVYGIRHVGLAYRSGIADLVHLLSLWPPYFDTTESIDGTAMATTRVLYFAWYC